MFDIRTMCAQNGIMTHLASREHKFAGPLTNGVLEPKFLDWHGEHCSWIGLVTRVPGLAWYPFVPGLAW
jgi:hypothetical protein